MKRLLVVLALLATSACNNPCEPTPPDLVVLQSGWWYVTLSDGRFCIARPWQSPERDTPTEALAECRAAAAIAPAGVAP